MQSNKKTMEAVVISSKMQKTCVVEIKKLVRHPVFQKYRTISKTYKVHDEKNVAQPGDRVLIRESKPISREKRWVLVAILEKAVAA
jgi:small subunit ribosomal protein S17